MHTYIDKIKEFLKPNRWKILITIILSIPFIFYLALANITEPYIKFLGVLSLITAFPSTLVMDMLYNSNPPIIISSLTTLINHYIWACIYFSVYKILTRKSMNKKDIIVILIFFLILFILFYIGIIWVSALLR